MSAIKNTYLILSFLAVQFQVQAQIGNTAPDFTVTDSHGEIQHLYDYLDSGKVVVLDFYFTTCGPCQYYSPQVNLAYQKYGCNTGKVIFLSIDYNDTDAEVLAYDAQYNIEYPSVSGLQGGGNAVVVQYGISGFPTFYVIDGTKKIIDQIDPPTLQVFDFRFAQHGILPEACLSSSHLATSQTARLGIFPNPVSGDLVTVDWPKSDPEAPRLDVFDCMGRFVQSEVMTSGEFETGKLAPGLYLLKVTEGGNGNTFTGTLVKN